MKGSPAALRPGSNSRPSGRGAPAFLAHQLARIGKALAALRAAAEPGIGLALATHPAARDLAQLGFAQDVAGTDDHRGIPDLVPAADAAGPVATDMQ